MKFTLLSNTRYFELVNLITRLSDMASNDARIDYIIGKAKVRLVNHEYKAMQK